MLDGNAFDFLGQLPPIVPLAFCGFLLLLVVSLGLLINMSTRRRQGRAGQRKAAKTPATIPVSVAEQELPDLDLLVGAEPLPGQRQAATAPVPVPAAGPARKAGTYWLNLSDGRRVEAADVLTVSRDLADGALIVQIGTVAYAHAADIADAEARRRLKAALRELAQQMTAAPRDTQNTPKAQAAAPVVPPDPPPAVRPAQPASPAPAPTPTGDGSWNLPNFAEMANEPLKLRGGMPKQSVPEINIASAIEAYLQHKLLRTPGFEQRRLHIHSAPGGGVQIEADGRFYEAVSDIEDSVTREFIAQAIQEWQSGQ